MHVDFISALQWQFKIQRYGSNLINNKCFNSHSDKNGQLFHHKLYEIWAHVYARAQGGGSGAPQVRGVFYLFFCREVSNEKSRHSIHSSARVRIDDGFICNHIAVYCMVLAACASVWSVSHGRRSLSRALLRIHRSLWIIYLGWINIQTYSIHVVSFKSVQLWELTVSLLFLRCKRWCLLALSRTRKWEREKKNRLFCVERGRTGCDVFNLYSFVRAVVLYPWVLLPD